MARVLILDDDPDENRLHLFRRCFVILGERKGMKFDITHVLTAKDCIDKLSESWDMIFLDHDLGGQTYVDTDSEDCGMRVAEWIENNPNCLIGTAAVFVHSLNVPAGQGMYQRLMKARKHRMDHAGCTNAPAVIHAPGIYAPSEFFAKIS